MKIFVAFAVLIALTMAEPPLSNSYLPPSPNQRNAAGYPRGGYPSGPHSGLPQIVAARSGPNGYSGHSPQGYSGQGYERSAAAFGRNALEQLNQEPANYNFEYMVNDFEQGADFGHHEERENESAHGEYHVVLPDGRKQTVSYEADERGFKPRISYEETNNFGRNGGYDSNANSVDQNGGGYHGNGNFRNNGGHGY